MRRLLALALVLICVPAAAWDGDDYWEKAPQSAVTSGGGGIWGTGGKRDFGITCATCHVEPANKMAFAVMFSPALGVGNKYTPGQAYVVSATLTETLGTNAANCNGLDNRNGFAATFEFAAGGKAGTLGSDTGAAGCPSLGTTTMTLGRCDAIVYRAAAAKDRTQWTFKWTAPAAGAGAVTLSWAAVDGSCDMMSMNDDVKTGTLALIEGP
jgi:hypothetical protein